MIPSTVWQKGGATAINATLAAFVAAPAAWWGFETWRVAWLAVFFAYNLALRDRCIGCRVMRIWQTRPAPVAYTALYTLGLASCVYYLIIPGDTLLMNGLIQWTFLTRTGNTAHGWLAGVSTQNGPR